MRPSGLAARRMHFFSTTTSPPANPHVPKHFRQRLQYRLELHHPAAVHRHERRRHPAPPGHQDIQRLCEVGEEVAHQRVAVAPEAQLCERAVHDTRIDVVPGLDETLRCGAAAGGQAGRVGAGSQALPRALRCGCRVAFDGRAGGAGRRTPAFSANLSLLKSSQSTFMLPLSATRASSTASGSSLSTRTFAILYWWKESSAGARRQS